MILTHNIHNDDETPEEEDSEVGLDDSMIAEISPDSADDDEPEGFGHIKESDEDEEDEEKEDGESLEEDAEDVDYDSFDDEDHL